MRRGLLRETTRALRDVTSPSCKPLVRKTQQDDRAPAASSRAAMLERYHMRW
jgi:hypothetical protein